MIPTIPFFSFLGLQCNVPTDVFGVSIGIYTILDLREANF